MCLKKVILSVILVSHFFVHQIVAYYESNKIVCNDGYHHLHIGYVVSNKSHIDETSQVHFYKSIQDPSEYINLSLDLTNKLNSSKKVPVILMPLVFINNNTLDKEEELHFKVCPTHYNKDFFYLDKSNQIVIAKNYTFPTRCSLVLCEIGLYINSNIFVTQSSTNFLKLNSLFFLALKSSPDGRPLYLGEIEYSYFNFPIILCPYINWINSLSYTTFEPNEVIKEIGFIPDEENLRHVYVPMFPMSENQNDFICGKINQPQNLDKIDVGYIFYNNLKDLKPTSLKINGSTVMCGNFIINSKFTWSYSSFNLSYKDNHPAMTYMGKNLKLYSGQYLLYYNLEEKHKQFIEKSKVGFNNDYTLETDLYIHNVNCVGEIQDVPATLKLKINGDFAPSNPIKPEDSEVIINSIFLPNENEHKEFFVSCHAEIDEGSIDMYNDFYKYRYKTKFVKGRYSDNSTVQTEINVLNNSKYSLKLYGFYSCVLDGFNSTDTQIKFSEYLILPEKYIIEKKVNISEIYFNQAACDKAVSDHINLSQMVVILSDGKIFYYPKNENNFKDINGTIVFKWIEKNIINGTKIQCIHKILGYDLLTIQKTLFFNSAIEGRKYSVVITKLKKIKMSKVILISLLVIIVPVIIYIICVIKKKSKKKSHSKRSKKNKPPVLSESSSSETDLSKPTVTNFEQAGSRTTNSSVIPSNMRYQGKKVVYM